MSSEDCSSVFEDFLLLNKSENISISCKESEEVRTVIQNRRSPMSSETGERTVKLDAIKHRGLENLDPEFLRENQCFEIVHSAVGRFYLYLLERAI